MKILHTNLGWDFARKSGEVSPNILPYASEVGRMEPENRCFQNHLRCLGSQNELGLILCRSSVANNPHEKRWWKLSTTKKANTPFLSSMSWSNLIQKWGLHTSSKLHPRRGFDSHIKHSECSQGAVQLYAPVAGIFSAAEDGIHLQMKTCNSVCLHGEVHMWTAQLQVPSVCGYLVSINWYYLVSAA